MRNLIIIIKDVLVNRSKKIDFFIVGAPKCGTTAFHSYLNSHCRIEMLEKEQHVYGSDLDFKFRPSNYIEAYDLDYDLKSKGDVLIGEGAVWYLVSETAAKELKKVSPNAQILIFLRNPIDAIYSLYSNLFFNGNDESNKVVG